MKRQIRNGVFETNSSSTHAICVSKDRVDLESLRGKKVTFTHDEFGWEVSEHSDTYTKADYLYQAIWDITWPDYDYDWNDKKAEKEYNSKRSALVEDRCERLKEILNKYGIDHKFAVKHYDRNGCEIGNIDHGRLLADWVEKCLNDEEYLLTYLFGDSMIITGNDNGEGFARRMHEYLGEDEYGWTRYDYHNYKPEFNNYEVYRKGN